jgi:hypothetical protein
MSTKNPLKKKNKGNASSGSSSVRRISDSESSPVGNLEVRGQKPEVVGQSDVPDNMLGDVVNMATEEPVEAVAEREFKEDAESDVTDSMVAERQPEAGVEAPRGESPEIMSVYDDMMNDKEGNVPSSSSRALTVDPNETEVKPDSPEVSQIAAGGEEEGSFVRSFFSCCAGRK